MCFFFFMLSIAVGINYCILAFTDPVDPRVNKIHFIET